jgi:hypothetical protein
VIATVVREGESTPVEFPRKEGARLFGVVIGTDGAPLVDCGLFLERAGELEDLEWQSTRTDSAGRYFFSGLAAGKYDLYVGRETFNDFVRFGEVALGKNEERDHDLVVGRASFRGTVRVAATKAPAAFAVLILERLDTPGGEPQFAGRSVTDSQGAYTFEYLEPGRYRVLAFPAQPTLAMALVDELSLLAGEHPDAVDFALAPGGNAQIRVVDPSGNPVPGATVRLRDGAGRTLSTARTPLTGENGVFLAEGLGAGTWDVDVEHPDFASTVVRFVSAVGSTVVVEVVIGR